MAKNWRMWHENVVARLMAKRKVVEFPAPARPTLDQLPPRYRRIDLTDAGIDLKRIVRAGMIADAYPEGQRADVRFREQIKATLRIYQDEVDAA